MVFVPSCGHCLPCSEGRPALCEPGAAANGAGTLLSGAQAPPPQRPGHQPPSRRVRALPNTPPSRAARCVKVDRELPLDEAALFGCAVLTGVGAVINTAKVPAGTTVAVVGLGGVGLSSILGAVASGASRVVAVDLSDEKLGLARQLGATDTFNAGSPDAANEIREAVKGGVEYAFEMAGSVRALDLAYKITRRGGTTVTAGLPPPTHTLALSPVNLVAEERTLKGSYIGTCVPVRDLPRYVDLYRRGKLPVDRLMSKHLRARGDQRGLRPPGAGQGRAPGGDGVGLSGVIVLIPLRGATGSNMLARAHFLSPLWGRTRLGRRPSEEGGRRA